MKIKSDSIHTTQNKERAVSEVIGFIIIFCLVMTGITLVTMYGYPMLLHAKQSADIKNMEKTFIVIQNEVKALVYKSIPTREMGMQINSGTFLYSNHNTDPENLIWVYYDDILVDPAVFPISTGKLEFTSEDSSVRIYLNNGAVINSQDSGSYMIAEPRFFLDSSSQFIPIIVFSGSDKSRDGPGLLKLKIISPPKEYSIPADPNKFLSIELQSDNPNMGAWRNYFVSLGSDEPYPAAGNLRFDFPPNRQIIIKIFYIEIESL